MSRPTRPVIVPSTRTSRMRETQAASRMILRHGAASSCLLLILATSHCSDSVLTSPKDLEVEASASGIDPRETSLQIIARGVALALQESATRASVFNAWRASEYTDHKLGLQTFCQTPDGNRLLLSLSAQLNVSEAAGLAMIQGLPPLDFYVPFRDHRKSWRGGNEVIVAATMDRRNNPTLPAFGTDGRRLLLQRSNGVPIRPLVILHPAEPKSRRVNAQADLPGPVIQDDDDGEVSGVVTTFLPNGDSVVREIADILPGRRRNGISAAVGTTAGLSIRRYIEPCEGCTGGGEAAVDTTYIHAFFINYEDDSEWGNHEVEFWAILHYDQIFAGDHVAYAKYRRDGIVNCYPNGPGCIYTQSEEPGVPLYIGPRLRYTQDKLSLQLKEVQMFNYTTDRGQNFWYVNQGWKDICEGGCVYNPFPPYRGGAEVRYTRHTGP